MARIESNRPAQTNINNTDNASKDLMTTLKTRLERSVLNIRFMAATVEDMQAIGVTRIVVDFHCEDREGMLRQLDHISNATTCVESAP